MLFLGSTNTGLWCGPGGRATGFFGGIVPGLAWDPMRAQTEPGLRPAP